MTKRLGIGTLALFGISALVVSARADEEKIPLDKVPAAVVKAFKAKFPKADIKAAIKEEEDGKTVYEIESVQLGLSIDAVLKPDGQFVEIEREIKASDLPAAVAAAVKAKFPKGEVKKAEEVTKGAKVFYEVLVQDGDKKTEIVLDKDGKVIEAEKD